ncbi:MAG: PAS domain-containing hybrid sensor histidine kinase/response regulator [Pseudomonadota bacterium]
MSRRASRSGAAAAEVRLAMFESWSIIAVALVYVSALFAIAWVGDRTIGLRSGGAGRPLVYALSLAVYCTSWTFFGSVGLAARTGYDFIPVYLGPILMFALAWPLVLRIVRVAKSQNITSVADFVAARYGKSQAVAAVVTLVAVVGLLPYIALQLKAVDVAIETLIGGSPLVPIELPRLGFLDTSLVITLTLAGFAILFGTRHIDATEHQDGLMLAVAAESLVKLAAFVAVGLFVTLALFGSPEGFLARARESAGIEDVFGRSFNGGMWLTVTLLSFVSIILLPRQFHVTVVENNSETEVRRAAWLFPLYLVLINLFVVPIAAAGIMVLPSGTADPDFYMLTLPLSAGHSGLALVAFVGGLSAATAMVIVESIALAIMVCNGLVIPALLRHRLADAGPQEDMTKLLLVIRRIAILALLLLGYLVYQALGKSQGLAAIGLVSFAAIAQLAPAFFGGLVWRKGTARGAIAGIGAGSLVWAYTLLLPWIAKSGWLDMSLVEEGPLGLGMLKPQALFYLHFEPLTHGVLWSIACNIAAFITVSLLRAPEPVERLQAHSFIADDPQRAPPTPAFRLWRTTITVGDLKHTVARYLGTERAERSFREYAQGRNLVLSAHAEADVQAIRFAEHVLASAIGAASARLVLSLLLRRGNVSGQSAIKLLDDASEALQYNRDLLQSALDQVRHGLSVFDKDMRLICWNRQFRELLNLPAELGRVGVPIDRILKVCAARGDFGPGDIDQLVAGRLMQLAVTKETFQERMMGGERILEIRTSPMPQGGIVTTYSDITERVSAANALARANETLERRVRERTAELLEVNAALEEAKAKADLANLDKTRFLAAASHDILQPLNAARLYAASLAERPLAEGEALLAKNVDASLSAVEEIFAALIEISRMDSGRLEPDIQELPLAEIFDQLAVEFRPLAKEKGLDLRVLATEAWVRSDRRMLRRVLQNLLGNAIKYTRRGGVLLGVRRRGGEVVITVSDTGPGIPPDQQAIVFKEFHRLEGAGSTVPGVGLGLSIVERIGRLLGHPVRLVSTPGRGSTFMVAVPRAAQRVRPRAEVASLPQAGRFDGVRVLCIDNEPAVLAGMEGLLSGWGCTVTAARSGHAALALAVGTGNAPDAILADYHLDTGTGLDAVVMLRAAIGAEVPAALITADQTEEVAARARAHGLSILRKPVKAAALRAMLAQMTLGRSQAAE